MNLIIAGYHVDLQSWEGHEKKSVLHKYIYISNDWSSIMKFYSQGISQCGNYFFYYLVKLDQIFNLTTPTHQFNIKNTQQMPKTLATHHFNELLSKLEKPEQLENSNNQQIGILYFCYNNETQHGFISAQNPNISLKKYREQKKMIFLESHDALKKALHEMVTHEDFYIVEDIVRKHNNQIDQISHEFLQLQVNKSICLNTLTAFGQF